MEFQMSDKSNKTTITEEDVSTILQRYTATTVLALLQEVAQVQDSPKLDWNALVKTTTTGITNPREYQMLWRHLAYRHQFSDNLPHDPIPLDDDSDLECELEAFPPVNNEASMEAAACVKVLIASGSTSDSGLEKGLTIEAPLTINIPNGKLVGNPSENPQVASNLRGTNITVPVSVQKQPQTIVASSTEGIDANGCVSGSLPPRRKRKPWSAAEDKELFAAVQKCGEGNWANILKGDFKGDRTASQLSQRWNIIKKRNNGNSNARTGSQLSEVHLAARRALNMALDQPGVDSLKASSSLGRTKSSITTNTSMRPIIPDTPSASTLVQDHASDDFALTKTFPKIRPKTSPKSLIPNVPDPVKAAAVAAGARIATQSAAAAILKQQLKSAIHIKTNVTNFRDLHSPSALRPQDHNSKSTPVVLLNPVSTAQETNGNPISSLATSPKKVQENQAGISGNVTKVEASGLNKNVQHNSLDKETKENAALPVVEPSIMETCKSQSAKQEQ